jgi:DNA invertase Pin-like site-specific DNA recombinase
VSTEQQEKMGESLRTQKAQIEQAVKALNGTLIVDPWRYSGQEHATAGFERKRFDQLLKDAEKGIFDAVIVVDPSRWSRDNVKSGQGLQVLRDAGIRFFVLQVEHDLFDPTAELFLGMTTQINQYVAGIQTQKSVRNRIARSARGLPTAGKLPYGRTFDKETET